MHCHSKKFAIFDFVEDTFARQFKKKRVSFWYCARLIVPLTFVEDTFARQFKKNEFLFGIVLA